MYVIFLTAIRCQTEGDLGHRRRALSERQNTIYRRRWVGVSLELKRAQKPK